MKTFAIVGILPSTASAGSFSLTIGGNRFSGALAASGVNPTPIPSITPVGSPTASPSASPGVTPTPNPTPTGNPGSSQTSKYYPLHTGDIHTLAVTTGIASPSDVGTRIGNLVTFKGKSAFRNENIGANGQISLVSFEDVTPGGYTAYGYEALSPTGSVTSSGEYVPQFTIPDGILNGTAGTFSYVANVVDSGGTTMHITFEGTGTPMRTQSVTVPAGTFNALKVKVHLTITGSSDGLSIVTTSDSTEYLVENVGIVKVDSTLTSQFGSTTSASVLKSATIGEKQYP